MIPNHSTVLDSYYPMAMQEDAIDMESLPAWLYCFGERCGVLFLDKSFVFFCLGVELIGTPRYGERNSTYTVQTRLCMGYFKQDLENPKPYPDFSHEIV